MKRKFSFFFAWYDLWIGAYFDRDRRVWYVCLLPCCVLKIERAIDPALCKWHEGDDPIDMEYGPPGCQGCGNLYKVKDCEGCGETFIDWGSRGYDDVISAPYVTASGDLYCARCGPGYDEEDERMIDDEADEWGGWTPYGDIEMVEEEPSVQTADARNRESAE